VVDYKKIIITGRVNMSWLKIGDSLLDCQKIKYFNKFYLSEYAYGINANYDKEDYISFVFTTEQERDTIFNSIQKKLNDY
jgi:hypothetical protein